MSDEELIKAALALKKEEDDELAKLLEAAGFLFVPVLLKHILEIESKMDDTLQLDYEEIAEKVLEFVRNKKKKPGKSSINRLLRHRSFKNNMKENVLPEMRKTFFSMFDEFNNKWSSSGNFDYYSKNYKSIERWLNNLPKLMDLTTKDRVTNLIQESYKEGRGTKWLEQRLSELPEFSRNRARTTAITEGLRMYSSGEFESFMQNDAIIGKTWRHTHGIKEPRKSHEACDGQTVAKDDFFIINGHSCLYPRDPNLPAKESIRCHCFMEPELTLENVMPTSENGIISMEADELTDCLRRISDGKLVDTTVKEIYPKGKIKGWSFDFNQDLQAGYQIRGVYVDGVLEGMVSFKEDPLNSAVVVGHVERKPGAKEYNGLLGHLFSEAIGLSLNKGYGGFIYFDAKKQNKLIMHYQKVLGAVIMGTSPSDGVSPRMIIEERTAKDIYDKYHKK